MAYIDCKLKSQILGTTVGVKLYFPTDLPADVGYTVKGVLTLLHGYTNSGDDWMQMTAAPRYAADNGLVLIMPDCGNSFYQNMMHGGAYKTFVTEELPMLLGRMFKLPARREQNFIAGLSMGGYGALFLGLSPAGPVRGLRQLFRCGGPFDDAGGPRGARRAGGVRPGVRRWAAAAQKAATCGCWPSGWPRCRPRSSQRCC
ncbi:MAG: alpha/beta hydrolase-fold protein [Ruthenibacterium lactatiformans]